MNRENDMVKFISRVDVKEISKEEVFFVDTNVLLAVHFVSSSSWTVEKVAQYAKFILGLFNNGNKICVSALNLQELCHTFENNEYQQYKIVNNKDDSFTKKKYRNIAEERQRLAKDLNDKHLEISEQYSVINGNVSNEMIKHFIEDYTEHFYDPVDFITVNYNSNGITNFITDDSDFKRDSRLTIYTYG